MYKSSVHEEIAFMKTVVCAQMFKDMSRVGTYVATELLLLNRLCGIVHSF